MHKISDETLQMILEQLDSFMGLMGFGREYNKIVQIVVNLAMVYNTDFSKYPNIMRELKRRNLR